VIELTPRAHQALAAADAAARRFNPEARVRLAYDQRGIRSELVEEPQPGDTLIEIGGLPLFVESGLAGTVDAGDHNELTLISR
jgi:hypothetical protein